MTRRKTDPKVTIIGVPTNSSGNIDGVARGASANNHYAGFGPGTVNIFRNMLGLPEAKWDDRAIEQERQDDLDVKQSTLSDFID